MMMQKRVQRRMLGAALGLGALCAPAGSAQDNGNWRAASKTASSITGDIVITPEKLSINLLAFTIAQIRALQPEEISAVFNPEGEPEHTGSTPAHGNLYRLSIPGDRRFLHRNTLCGSDETQWMLTDQTDRRTLQIAFFSGSKMPVLTREGVANTTDLCGTFTYVR